RAARQGPAPQRLVLGAEDHLRVRAVGERHEAGVPVEVGGGPLPDVAEHLLRPVGPAVARGRRLPLGFGREAGAPPAGERVRLVPAQMLDGLVERESLAPAVATARPGTVALALPVLRRAAPAPRPPLPAAGGPEPRVVVAAVLDEGAVLAVRDRRAVDPERRQLDVVARAFVVVHPGALVGADGDDAAGQFDHARRRAAGVV